MANITVFEHSFLSIDSKFEQRHFVALSRLNALHGDKYFSLRHNGIVFKQYVGVIQIEGLTIEILPKIDKNESDKALWQGVLIQMLKITKKLKVQQTDRANVNKQQIHLLDIYFEWYLNEVQRLIHQGLIKQYYKKTGNVKALKGKLEFSKHIVQNLVHKERFYTTHQVYDKDHLIHQILGQALSIVATMSKGGYLYSRCKSIELDFPEVKPIQANESTFSRLPNSRKTAPYQTALALARLIILNYAPNVSAGNERMLALLFDMNSLWEEYILTRLRQTDFEGVKVYGQLSKQFWKDITIRPDIVIEHDDCTYVIDTKWKNIENADPSTNDLRQMYVYNDYWKSDKAMLLYPSSKNCECEFETFRSSDFHHPTHACTIARVSIFKEDTKELNDKIGETILKNFVRDSKDNRNSA